MGILGIDEVGRGPWAGPLVIGAVILPKDETGDYPDWVAPLTDSKKLSEKKREAYSKIILKEALATGLGWVSSKEIDELGLSESLKLATRRAIEEVQKQKVPFTEIIIDGTQNFLKGTKLESYVTTLKKGDLLIKEISAASIIAKVARDHYMKGLAEKCPNYGFEKHVGYGTKLHKEMLAKFGPCPEHRFSFGPIGEKRPFEGPKTWPSGPERSENGPSTASGRITTKQLGDRAEDIVANHLISRGHKIIARNHKTKFYEIDIVSTKDDKIYFTEVKYRKNQSRGTSLDMITKQKLQKMTFAAESFLKYYKDFQTFSPLLAAGLVHGEDFTFDDWFILD
ncbi:ribonuclease HII [Candidatus Saccharibacteria bacterium]|nr:ribonuclease HII [Candidatus Saccharibacteria bacterium]